MKNCTPIMRQTHTLLLVRQAQINFNIKCKINAIASSYTRISVRFMALNYLVLPAYFHIPSN